MKLTEFLDSRPDLVEKINKCSSEEEIEKVIQNEVTTRELHLIHLEYLDDDEMEKVSGGGSLFVDDTLLLGSLFNGEVMRNLSFFKGKRGINVVGKAVKRAFSNVQKLKDAV